MGHRNACAATVLSLASLERGVVTSILNLCCLCIRASGLRIYLLSIAHTHRTTPVAGRGGVAGFGGGGGGGLAVPNWHGLHVRGSSSYLEVYHMASDSKTCAELIQS